jgi:hypothetical protein
VRVLILLTLGFACVIVLVPLQELRPTWFFPMFCLAVVALYGASLFGNTAIPPTVRDAAYFSAAILHFFAIAICIMALPLIVLFLAYGGSRDSMIVPIAALAGAVTAPIGLLAMRYWNRHLDGPRKGRFWRGGLFAIPAAALSYVPEFAWANYHELRLRHGEAATVMSSLHTLANVPFGRRRFGPTVCFRLLLRDIADPYFMYGTGTEFLPDHGVGEIEKHLRDRFGSAAQDVVDTVRSQFGQDFFARCSDWRNPTSN